MDNSGEYTVEYKFTADVKGLEQGVKQAKDLVKDATNSVGKDFKVNWGEGTGSIEDYTKWLGNANKEWEEYVAKQASATSSTESFTTSMSSLSKTTSDTAVATEATAGSMGTLESAFWETADATSQLDFKTQALLATITALETKFAKDSLDAFAKYEDAIYGMAVNVGNTGGTIEQAMEAIRTSTASGLVSETDASKAISLLTTYGYSVEEASRLVEEFTNVSMAHRDATKSVSEQVVSLAEATKNENSRTLERLGLLGGSTDAMNNYALSIGETSSQLDAAERRQAMFNAVIQQGEQDSAVASAYQETYSAATQRLSNAMSELKTAFGQALAPLLTWLANAATWLAENKELVVGIGTFIGVIAGAGGLIVAITKLLPMIGAAISFFSGLHVATKGVILGLATVAATMAVVAATSSSLTNSLKGINNQANKNATTNKDATESYNDLGSSISGVGAAARDTSAELEKLRKQYLDELKTIESRHQETIAKLTKQIQEANVDYRRAVEERNAEFAVQQAKEEKTHQEKVDEIMTQIAFLQRYNNDYNKQKLANLEFALAKENALYQKQTEAERAELEIQNENDKKAYEEKRSTLQAELDQELAFMNKHRADLLQVQDYILQDEIEKLNERYQEQLKSYELQAGAAGGAGVDIAEALAKNFKDTIENFDFYGTGKDAGNYFGTGLSVALSKTARDISEWWSTVKAALGVGKGVEAGSNDDAAQIQAYFQERFGDRWREAMEKQGYGHQYNIPKMFASGGYTGYGNSDEIAGLVHKGEYVLPQEMVDQNTGTPKSLGNTFVININGTFATSAAERRKVADQIVQAINQNNKSRLEATWQ